MSLMCSVSTGTRVRGIVLVVLLLLVASVVVAFPAWAYVPDTPKRPYYADSLEHTYYISTSTLASSQQTNAKDAMNYLGDNTSMTVKAVSLTTSTDVYMYGAWPTTAPYTSYYAWTTCINASNDTFCDRFRISINRNKTHNNWRSVFCHEIGHTLGFGHPGGNNSDATAAEKTCMRSSPDVTVYSDNDRFWINWWY